MEKVQNKGILDNKQETNQFICKVCFKERCRIAVNKISLIKEKELNENQIQKLTWPHGCTCALNIFVILLLILPICALIAISEWCFKQINKFNLTQLITLKPIPYVGDCYTFSIVHFTAFLLPTFSNVYSSFKLHYHSLSYCCLTS